MAEDICHSEKKTITMPFQLQDQPFTVPAEDGKLIEEFFGAATSGDRRFSVAHMVAPPGWGEPHQQPGFDEVTVVIRGKKMVEVDGFELIIEPGKVILVNSGSRVRYSNPFSEPCEYWSFCIPAFTLEQAGRE